MQSPLGQWRIDPDVDLESLFSSMTGTVRNEVERLVLVVWAVMQGGHSHLWNRVAVPLESGTAALSRSYMAFMMEANF